MAWSLGAEAHGAVEHSMTFHYQWASAKKELFLRAALCPWATAAAKSPSPTSKTECQDGMCVPRTGDGDGDGGATDYLDNRQLK